MCLQLKSLFTISLFSLLLTSCASTGPSPTTSLGRPWIPDPSEDLTNRSSDLGNYGPSSAAALVTKGELDLPMMMDIAFENSPETRRAWHLAKAAAARREQAKSQFYPTVEVSAGGDRERIEGPAGLANYRTAWTGPALQLNYTIFNFGANGANLSAAQEMLQAANYQYNRSLQQVLHGLQIAYFKFNAALAEVESNRASLDEAKETCRMVEARWQAGLGNRQNYLQARADMLQRQYQLERSRAGLETCRAELARLLGVRIDGAMRILPCQLPDSWADLDVDVQELISEAIRSRPDLLAGYAQLKAARNQLLAAEKSRYPQFVAAVKGAWGHYSRGPSTKNGSLFLGLSWTLFDGYSRTGKILEERARVEVAREDLRSLELQAMDQVWTAFHDYRSAVREAESTRALLAAAAEAFGATQLTYKNGLGSFLDLLRAQDDLALARRQNVLSQTACLTALANLAYATGNFEKFAPVQ